MKRADNSSCEAAQLLQQFTATVDSWKLPSVTGSNDGQLPGINVSAMLKLFLLLSVSYRILA